MEARACATVSGRCRVDVFKESQRTSFIPFANLSPATNKYVIDPLGRWTQSLLGQWGSKPACRRSDPGLSSLARNGLGVLDSGRNRPPFFPQASRRSILIDIYVNFPWAVTNTCRYPSNGCRVHFERRKATIQVSPQTVWIQIDIPSMSC